MPASLWHWQYFQTRPHNLKSPGDRDHYNGGIYANTWCRTCIASCISVMEQEDQKALEEGVISKVRPQNELLRQALSLVRPIPGRREAFEAHIRSCEQIPPEAKDRLASERMRTHSLTPNTENHSKLSPHPAPATIYNLLSKEQQDEFNFDLCKLWIANGFAWHAINAPETYKFFQKWLPGATLPDCHKLSGPILWTQLEAANTSMHNAISGRLATGMSDGWKNVRCNALIASMLSVDYKTYTVRVHDLSAQHKTAENHLKLVLSDIDKTKKEHNVRVIAWVSDAGGDSRAMRVQLHRLRPHILVFDCWAHQINLVVGDIMSLTSRLVDTADDAINIIKWMLNHLYLLGLFRQEQARDGRKPRSLALPVLTRWTSHFLSFRSLLSESQSLRALAARNPKEFRASAGRTPELVQQAKTVLKNIDDPEFWLRLNELKLYLEPLAIAANVSQAATTRLDHILVELGRLYYTFSNLGFNPKIRECVLESLERRWGKADQDPFILAVFLNPFIRARLFSRKNTSLNRSALYGIVKRVFRRVFCKENDLELYKAFLDYYNSRNEFHPDRWDYEEQRAMHERAGKPLNMIHVWSGLLAYETPNSGRHQLAHLAIHVLSIVANSAGCERLFSEMGHIHTKRRNRLGYQKVFDTAVVRMDLKRKHADEGRTRSRLKRQFGSPALDSVVSGAGAKRNNQPDELAESIGDVDAIEEELVTPSVRSLITQLRQDVLDDEDPLDDEPDEPPVATLPKKVRLFFGTQFPIPLRDLFDYSRNTESEVHGLDFFKSNGLNNLDAELELYGLVTRDIQKGLEIDDSTV
ncbi:hAT family dimerization protein [Rhizoctonia solani]|uniref:HAT family dimerization protein n=1 Tax=Rhizoctonia solani TaxID=456999 RepID=A0A8H8NRE7_9AGAM|nr:hAT family dimerization protein [Rhizoctonia solani]QRW17960.1 hAT family dimerization protein [Rhizoctonia solani]